MGKATDSATERADPDGEKAVEIRRASESPEGSGQAVDRAAADGRTSVGVVEEPKRSRTIGVDAARGVALVGMIANHTYPEAWPNGAQTIPQMVAGGRASATFALLAGVGIALMSGGQRPVRGRARTAARVGLLVRGLLVSAIGLALAYTDGNLDIILAYFGLFFIFAIPLLGLSARALWVAAFAIALLVPVLFHLIGGHLGDRPFDANPDFGTLIHHPSGLLVALCATGFYPALPWMAFICAGMAAGRLQLSSPRIAARLLIGGLALAATVWGISSLLLHPLGGLHHLVASLPNDAGMSSADVHKLANRGEVDGILPTWSWWWLAIRAPHTAAPLDLLHVMGSALALLGGMLLLTRVAIFARLLTPLALAGGMTLTIYSVHVAIFPLLGDSNFGAQLAVQIAAALVFAVLWRRKFARGPLETLLAAAARWARRAVTEHPPLRMAGHLTDAKVAATLAHVETPATERAES